MPLALPPALPDETPTPFPLAGVLAPVIVAALLFAVTRSPLTLAFAALGPVVAVASLFDGRSARRRVRRRAVRRRRAALDAVRGQLEEELAARRRALIAAHPAPAELLRAPGLPVARADSALPVVLGRGAVPSGLRFEPVEDGDEELVREAALLREAPVLADARGGIGVVGPQLVADALARALAVQVLWHGARTPVRLPTARVAAELPEHCAVVVEVLAASRGRVLRHPDPQALVELRPELVSLADIERFRDRMAAPEPTSALPMHVPLGDLPVAGGSGLSAAFLADAAGPVVLDLVRDGPHAVVGGTTGSGKSELLVAWVLALAAAHPPERLSFLLVDFKGGTAFDPLTALPHVSGVVTDLDGPALDRLAVGLRAEVRRREEALRTERVRDVAASRTLGRLVVVIDEFAALLAGHPDLFELVADLAARGRALGVHLILATQRPGTTFREALLSNCGLRLCLRVLSSADSEAVVGTPDAARLPRAIPGRVLVSRAGEPATSAQSAIATAADLSRVTDGTGSAGAARPPVWLPPLPADLLRTSLPVPPPDALALGLVDQPARRRQPVAVWTPERDGALLAVGARGTGRSTLLATLAEQRPSVRYVDGSRADAVETLWDAVTAPPRGLLLVDDLDVALTALAALGPDAATEVMERLGELLRDPGAAVAATLRAPLTGPARSLPAAFPVRVLLRTSREDHTLLGGDPSAFDAALPPGGGWWRGDRLQIARPRRPLPDPVSPLVESVIPLQGHLLVTTRPRQRVEQLARRLAPSRVLDLTGAAARSAELEVAGSGAALTVVDPDTWHTTPALWALAGRMPMLFDGCSVSDYRLVTRRRDSPPALARTGDRGWLLEREQPVRRVVVEWTER